MKLIKLHGSGRLSTCSNSQKLIYSLLSVCCFTPIYGRLCNIIGRKASLLVAVSFFSMSLPSDEQFELRIGFGTTLCAFAPSMNTLIAARAIAGIGGGGITSGKSYLLVVLDVAHEQSGVQLDRIWYQCKQAMSIRRF